MPRRIGRLAFISVAAALGLSAGAAQEAAIDEPRFVEFSTPNLERGRAIAVGAYTFGTTPEPQTGACFQCHGIDGRGDGTAAFPRLTDQVYKYLYDSLQDYASGVRESPIMGPIAKALTDEEMRDVAAYYAAQTDAPYPPRPEADPEVLQSGGALAAVGSTERGVQGCINCHGPEGVGLPPTYPYLAGQYVAYLESQLLAWKDGTRAGDGFGIMARIAERLTEEEIRAVSLYYASLRPPEVTPDYEEDAFPMVPIPGETARELGR